jgi:hypothetical protein
MFHEGRPFLKKMSNLIDAILYSSFVLPGIGSGKVDFKAQGKAYRPVLRKGYVVVER